MHWYRFPVFVMVACLAAATSPAAVEDLEIQGEQWRCSADGRPLQGVLVVPDGPGPFPGVLLSHGLGGSAEGLLGRARKLAAAGFAAVAVDYAHAGRGQMRNPDNGASAENVRRALAALDILSRQPKVDGDRMSAWGFSMGALLTVALAAEHPDRLQAAVVLAGGVQQSPARLYPSVAQAGKIRTPVLMLHGEADARVKPESSAMLAKILEGNGVPHARRVYPGVDHTGILREEDAERRALAWLQGQREDATAGTAPAPEGRALAPTAPWVDPDRNVPAGLLYKTFHSETIDAPVSYVVYLPPSYETAPERRYPVVYWLHGRGGGQNGARNLAERAGPAVEAGVGPEMIVIGVNGLRISSYVDAEHGKAPVQTVLTKDLVAHVDATYRTIARREARGIEGFSMGGAGAAKVGFRNPELFGVVSSLAGAMHDLDSMRGRGETWTDIYGSSDAYFQKFSPWTVVESNADEIRGRTKVRLVVGGADGLLAFNKRYHEWLDKLGIEHEFTVVPGVKHTPGPLYDGLGDRALGFFREAFAGLE